MLILHRNGEPVDFTVREGASFYYSPGMIGNSSAVADWAFDQQLFDYPDGEPVLRETVTWSLVAAPEPEPLTPTPEQLRQIMPRKSPVEFRLMLDGLGFDDSDVQAAIGLITDPVEKRAALIHWEYATYFERVNPFIDGIGALLGMTPEDIDGHWKGEL